MKNLFLFSMLIAISTCACNSETGSSKQPTSSADQGTPQAAASSESTSSGEYVSFPSVGVKMIRPKGFEDSPNFHGFQQQSTGSSVMIVSFPAPFSTVMAKPPGEALASRGMKLQSKEDLTIAGKSGVLWHVKQEAYGTEYEKWIAAFGDDQNTTMVVAVFPQAHAKQLSESLKAIVLGVKIDTSAPPKLGTEVDFRVTPSDKLKLTHSIEAKILAYTKDGVIPLKSPQDPMFIVARSLAKSPAKNKRQFAVDRFMHTAGTKVNTMPKVNQVTIDGLDGYELLADAQETASGIPIILYQVLLFDQGEYILMQGLVGKDLADEYLKEFKAMANSFKSTR